MAAFVKFNDFVEQLGLAKHNLNTDTLKCVLTNTDPTATATILSGVTQVSNGNGYTTGGEDSQNTWAESSGTATLTGTAITWTASGAVGPFQYVVMYNDTQTSPVDPLVGYWNYGSSISLSTGETFTIKFNNSATTGSILTLS